MLYDQAIQKLKLNTDEYIRNVEDIPETPATMKAHIQKLMPNIPIGEGPITNIKLQINHGIFVNAKDCKLPNTKSVLNGQNFVTLKPFNNERPNFRSKAKLNSDGEYIVEKHNQFIATILHEDIGNIYFTGRS